MAAAEDWHVPPWVVEAEVTEEWWERWLVWREERAAARTAAEREKK